MTEDEMREFWDSLPLEIGNLELSDEEKKKISGLLHKSAPETMPVEEWNIPKEFMEFAEESYDRILQKGDELADNLRKATGKSVSKTIKSGKWSPAEIDHPSYYNGDVECIDAMIQTQGVEAVKSFCLCCAFKYLWRHNEKGGDEDIEKAVWYLEKYLELGRET